MLLADFLVPGQLIVLGVAQRVEVHQLLDQRRDEDHADANPDTGANPDGGAAPQVADDEAGGAGPLRDVGPELGKKLSLEPGRHLLVQAGFTLDLRETVIGNDGTFDRDQVPVSVTLILKPSEKRK